MIIFAISLISIDYFCVPFTLESTSVFLIMMISSIILLKGLNKIKDINLFLFVIGAITSFSDFLTVPLITLGIPLCIYILNKQKEEKITYKQYIKMILKASIAWGLGYVLIWGSKWIIYDLVYQKKLIFSAIQQVMYRTQNNNYNSDVTFKQSLAIFTFKVFIIISIVNIGYGIKTIINMKKKNRPIEISVNHMFPFLIIATFPYLWYFATINHTTQHIVFVYRHMLVFVVGVLLCIDELLNNKNIKKYNR